MLASSEAVSTTPSAPKGNAKRAKSKGAVARPAVARNAPRASQAAPNGAIAGAETHAQPESQEHPRSRPLLPVVAGDEAPAARAASAGPGVEAAGDVSSAPGGAGEGAGGVETFERVVAVDSAPEAAVAAGRQEEAMTPPPVEAVAPPPASAVAPLSAEAAAPSVAVVAPTVEAVALTPVEAAASSVETVAPSPDEAVAPPLAEAVASPAEPVASPPVESVAPPPAEAVVPVDAATSGADALAPPTAEATPRAPSAAPAAGASRRPPAAVDAPSGRVRVVLNFDESDEHDRTPPALSVDAAPHSARGVVDDELRAFFDGAEEAVAREREAALAELREELKPKAPPSPVQIARRDRARRVVTYVMGGAVVLFGLGSVRFALHDRGPVAAASLAQDATPLADVAAPATPPAQAVASALPAPRRLPSATAAQELARKADESLGRRRYREAIEHAARAVEADPSDAGAYVVWGKALDESGQRAEAKRVFSQCLERATEGPKGECDRGR